MKGFKFVLGFALLFAMGCGRGEDFLFDAGVKKVVQFQRQAYSHKLVEMIGIDKLDILWVIDNSGSMYSSQQAVSQNTGLFMKEFAGLHRMDWRMTLLSTDTANPPFLGMSAGKFLDATSLDPVGAFQAAVAQLGIDGSTTEMTYSPILQALNAHPEFLRPDVYLAIIVLTDEEEQSPMTTPQFLAELSKFKALDHVITYGVFSDSSLGGTCDGSAFGNPKYQELIQATHGTIYPLCSPNFGDTLTSIGSQLGSIATQPVFQLTAQPVVGTIRVFYHGQQIPGGPKDAGGFWRYDFGRNAVVFHDTSFVINNAGDIQVDFQTEINP